MIQVNLIPAHVQLGQMRRQRLRVWAAGNAVVAVAVIVPFALEWLNQARAEELQARNVEVQQQLSAAAANLRAVRDEAEQLHLQIRRADALRSKRAWSGMLGLIAGCMPPGSWLTQLATDPPAPRGAGGAATPRSSPTISPTTKAATPPVVTIEAPRKLRLIGYASTAAEPLTLVTNLKDTGVFARVTLERSQLDHVNERAAFRFEVVCEW